jgi:hypothetical protein
MESDRDSKGDKSQILITGESKDEQGKGIAISSSFVNGYNKREKEQAPIKQTFRTARLLAKQQTRPVPVDGDLFSLLSDSEKAYAIQIQKENGLLSQITDGINVGVLASKVIIGLAQTLAEQSEMYGTEKEMLGISKDELEKEGVTLKAVKNFNGVYSPYPMIRIKGRNFTQLVKGVKDVSRKDRKDVEDVIGKLANLTNFIKLNGKYVGVKLLSIEANIIDPVTKERGYLIMLRPIFINAIKDNFVTMRKDTLQKLSGKTPDITMKLFWWLAEQHSYKGTPIYPTVKVRKNELFQRIAIIKSYDKNKVRLKEDFDKAIEKMKEMRLITGYKEETGADGSTNSIFTLNKLYTTEGKEIPKEDNGIEEV